MMHNQRTNPVFRKIRDMVHGGELGGLKRYIWICTDWYRSQAYYNLGGWRATWVGEGGGMLINQCPHNMDLLQWIFGMPNRLWAKSICGKYHQIEVEDDATVYLEYEKGFTGMLLASTGESPAPTVWRFPATLAGWFTKGAIPSSLTKTKFQSLCSAARRRKTTALVSTVPPAAAA